METTSKINGTLSEAAVALSAVRRNGGQLWVCGAELDNALHEELSARGATLQEAGAGMLCIDLPPAVSEPGFWAELSHIQGEPLHAAHTGAELGDQRFASQHGSSAPVLMGILNTTPDSFSDGGAHALAKDAIARGKTLLAEGATWIDVGGESTRPGAIEVPADEEIARVLPVIEALAADGARISIDTRKAAVAEAALSAGASLVNDVSGGLFDPRILDVAAKAGASYCAMHMRGTPGTMQQQASYDDAALEVTAALRMRARAAIDAGIHPDRLWLDPGIGFAKALPHNLAVLRELDVLASLGFPLLVGLSRKKMIGQLTDVAPPRERVAGSLAGLAVATANGAHILRVHDVRESAEALAVAAAISGRA